jgi:hypothetical protein
MVKKQKPINSGRFRPAEEINRQSMNPYVNNSNEQAFVQQEQNSQTNTSAANALIQSTEEDKFSPIQQQNIKM